MATTDKPLDEIPIRWSVVVPAFNESQRIGTSLDAMLSFFRARGESFEILVVDDGSEDATATSVESRGDPEIEVLRSGENLGKGSSTRKGVNRSRGELVLLTDADLPVPLDTLDAFVGELDEGWDIVCGSKALEDSEAMSPQPIHRRGLGRVFNGLVRGLGLSDFRDTQCGFKLFRGHVARRLFSLSRINGFVFDVEILCLARQIGIRSVEKPVRFRHVAQSRVSALGGGRHMLAELVRLRFNIWRGRYRVDEPDILSASGQIEDR